MLISYRISVIPFPEYICFILQSCILQQPIYFAFREAESR